MKTKELKDIDKKRLPDFTIDPALNNKYDNDPFLNKKAEEAKELIKKVGIPKF